MKHSNGVHDAKEFLELLENNADLRAAVRRLTGVQELGEKYQLKFNNHDLEKALEQKWGPPTNRCDDPAPPDPWTCCCI